MKTIRIVVISLLFVLLAALPAIAQEVIDVTDSSASVKEITVENDGLSFIPEEIRVNEGDRIRLTFRNTGGFHDWVIDEFDAATSQYSGGTSETIEFVADEAGEFEFYCSVGNHRARGMWGTFIVEG
ncbi:MAG: cupredoxin domain-containing protein [Spirochaeta sp.]|jgi:plastocyanin|nr:cupredoxin domain-containing protein [Spirochaeta sp.]